MEETEHSHFKLNQGESLSYRVIPSPDAPLDEKVYISLTPSSFYRSNIRQCSKKTGCDFIVTAAAQQDLDGTLYIGKSADLKEMANEKEII